MNARGAGYRQKDGASPFRDSDSTYNPPLRSRPTASLGPSRSVEDSAIFGAVEDGLEEAAARTEIEYVPRRILAAVRDGSRPGTGPRVAPPRDEPAGSGGRLESRERGGVFLRSRSLQPRTDSTYRASKNQINVLARDR